MANDSLTAHHLVTAAMQNSQDIHTLASEPLLTKEEPLGCGETLRTQDSWPVREDLSKSECKICTFCKDFALLQLDRKRNRNG